jgi:alpha-maltose-1-phosphate synthase
MRVALLSREFPPEVYGGAGVHVEYLVRELRPLVELDVHCFGAPRQDSVGAIAHQPPPSLAGTNPALATLGVDLDMVAAIGDSTLVHSHTWYAGLAGHLAGLLYDVPHVVTAHSLEPARPWKAEQLGGGYRVSSWAERTAFEAADAVIAVSDGMRRDVLATYPRVDPARVHVVRNGIDTQTYHRVDDTDALVRYGVDPHRPYVIFVGRITRQKGLAHLVRAAAAFDKDTQIVLCAGAPDTPELAEEIRAGVAELQATRDGVVWITEMLDRSDVVQLLSHATIFCCPSVYEPLGIVNLEAMACEVPVVASRVGGIPEVVDDGVTGLLVEMGEAGGTTFEDGLADAVNTLLRDPDRARSMGLAGRARAVDEFGWPTIARQTVAVYGTALG